MNALKVVHVVAAVVFLGTGLGTAWFKWRADRSGELPLIAWAQRTIVLADWCFTIPAGLALPVTGLLLAHGYHLPLSTPWIMGGIACYAVAGLCWLPAAFLQVRMRRLTEEALRSGAPLPSAFHRANRAWLLLGVPSFGATLLAVWLMVTKGV